METTQQIQNVFSRQEKICIYGNAICASIMIICGTSAKIMGYNQTVIDQCALYPGLIAVAFAACLFNNMLLRNSIMSKLNKVEVIKW
jgi:hypothetical protein